MTDRLIARSRYLPFQAAHSPMQVPEEFQRQYSWYEPCQKFRSTAGSFGENKNYNCAPPVGGLSGAGTQVRSIVLSKLFKPCNNVLLSFL